MIHFIDEYRHKYSKNHTIDPKKRHKMHFFQEKVKIYAKKFGTLKKVRTFAIPNNKNG